MTKKYDSIEDLKTYISKLENNLAEYEDEYFNIQKSIDGCKSEINSIQLLQQNMKDDNFQKWQQLPNLEKQVEEIEEDSEISVNDILNQIL